MDTLLNGLLRYSRLGRVVLTIQRIEMGPLLNEIVAAMKYQIDDAKARVVIGELPDSLGDRAQASQVFANLFDNALKYRSPHRALKITVEGRVENGMSVYSVADNGIGIAKDHQAKVFEIFHRLDPMTTQGEGLGLSIAQRVLERQRGKIWVESAAGEGSIFHVSLPSAES